MVVAQAGFNTVDQCEGLIFAFHMLFLQKNSADPATTVSFFGDLLVHVTPSILDVRVMISFKAINVNAVDMAIKYCHNEPINNDGALRYDPRRNQGSS